MERICLTLCKSLRYKKTVDLPLFTAIMVHSISNDNPSTFISLKLGRS